MEVILIEKTSDLSHFLRFPDYLIALAGSPLIKSVPTLSYLGNEFIQGIYTEFKSFDLSVKHPHLQHNVLIVTVGTFFRKNINGGEFSFRSSIPPKNEPTGAHGFVRGRSA